MDTLRNKFAFFNKYKLKVQRQIKGSALVSSKIGLYSVEEVNTDEGIKITQN